MKQLEEQALNPLSVSSGPGGRVPACRFRPV
jgi:hypothetical protein